jgi:hypothetical protein
MKIIFLKIDRISFVLPAPALDYLIWDLSSALPDLWGLYTNFMTIGQEKNYKRFDLYFGPETTGIK